MLRRIHPRTLIAIVAILLLGLGLPSGLPVVRAQGSPTVKVTSPSNGSALANPVTITVQTSGAVIKDASAGDPNAAHLHYFIDRDPATVLRPGQPIPTGQADIIHTPNTSQVLPNLAPGPHTVWVVLAHTDHTPYSPNVQDQVSFTVGGATGAAGAGTGAPSATPAQLPPGGTGGLLAGSGSAGTSMPWALFVVAALLTAGGLLLLRRGERSGA